MLASKNCVKCICDGDECMFTTDVFCLLSNIDIEHPVGEFLLQALEAHKKKYRTGVKTLLFMITRLAKVVSQLHNLNVSVKKSLRIIKVLVDEVIQDVMEICIPVTTSTDMHQCEQNFTKNTKNLISVECLNPFSPDNSHEDQSHSSDYHKAETVDALTAQKIPCEQGLLPSDDISLNICGWKKSYNNLKDVISDDKHIIDSSHSIVTESDPVFLKMTAVQESTSNDDISWFFDSNNGSATESSDGLVISTAKGTEIQMFNSKSISATASDSTFQKQQEKEIGNENEPENNFPHKHELVNSKDDHDSDFEDCFDDDENRKHFVVTVETATSVPLCNDFTGDKNLLMHNARKHFCKTHDFDDAQEMSQSVLKKNNFNKDDDDDEFSACFENTESASVHFPRLCEEQSVLQSVEGINHHQKMEEVNVRSKVNLTTCVKDSSICPKRNNGVNKFDNDEVFNSQPLKDCAEMSNVAKLNTMLDSLMKQKYSNKSISKSFSPRSITSQSRNMKTSDCKESVCIKEDKPKIDITKPSQESNSVNDFNPKKLRIKKNNEVQDKKELLSVHHVLLNDLLSMKQKNLKHSRSHQVAMSSRHFSNNDGIEEHTKICDELPITNHQFTEKCDDCEKLFDVFTDDSENSQGQRRIRQPVSYASTIDSFRPDKLHGAVENSFCEPTMGLPLSWSQGLLLPYDARLFVNSEFSRIAEQLLIHQVQDEKFTEFNLKLVDSLCVPITQPTFRRESEIFVQPGLILPCDFDICEKMSSYKSPGMRKAILVKADLTPDHHHKGHKSTLANKVFVSSLSNTDKDSSENVWAASVVTAVKELGINMLLVKGNIQEKLLYQLESAGVVALANVPYHTLSVLAYVNRVDMITYVADACMGHVFDIEIQPLSSNWMDRLNETDKLQKQFFKIVNSSEVQTVVISHSSKIAANLAEEKLWRSLNSLSNAVKDKKVLPGAGKTEVWCAKVLEKKAALHLEGNRAIHHAVSELLSEVFRDYAFLVQQNSYQEQEDNFRILSGQDQSHTTGRAVGFGINKSTTAQLSSYQMSDGLHLDSGHTETYKLKNGSKVENEVGASGNKRPSSFFSKEGTNAVHLSRDSDLGNSKLNVYDNFSSKIALWESAVDVVSVLSKLDSLVVTGVDSTLSLL
ncbi:Bardet-Biedl syndrome 12 protein homolog [Plakobranchus ocellatus]|uniref:Bardet-Biedl syndrome 12 protein homolog n=1 Tax=Plakobranchus ocellatus TaxID=259542 RepID=A0AAV4E264_9GAST|nr:Bardet-Biedl syndrome 12 protein homolog [Plakobranchus ocellatus]